MPLSKNLNAYYDVAQVLMTLRQAGGGFYELPTHGLAILWRTKAYYYRTLLIKAAQAKNGSVPGFVPTTDWDDMYITVVGNTVRVEFGALKGVLKTLSGETLEALKPAVRSNEAGEILARTPLRPKPEEAVEIDDLEEAAKELRGKLE